MGRKFDCSSANSGSLESCSLTNIEAGSTLFIVVEAYQEFTDLVLTCSSYSEGSVEEVVQLKAGRPSEPFRLSTNQVQDFTLETNDEEFAACMLKGDSGDADLYLRWSEAPVIEGRLRNFDCASENEFSAETCTVANPGNATTLWAKVFAFRGFNGIVITCTGTSDPLAFATPAADGFVVAQVPESSAEGGVVKDGSVAGTEPHIANGGSLVAVSGSNLSSCTCAFAISVTLHCFWQVFFG